MANKDGSGLDDSQAMVPHIRSRIQLVRGVQVILSPDLAELYGVTTKQLNQQVSRNEDKFEGVAFKLNKEEFKVLRSQNVTSKRGRGGPTHPPRAFTVRGAIMAATVLRSERAVKMSQLIVDVFVDVASQIQPPDEAPALPASSGRKPRSLVQAGDAPATVPELKSRLHGLVDRVFSEDTRQVVARETRETARRALAGLQEYLDKPGLNNEETRTRIAQMIARTEHVYTLSNKALAEAEAINLNNRLTELAVRLAAESGDTGEVLDVILQLLSANRPGNDQD